MKNVLIISLIGLVFFSCSKDDGDQEDNFYFQILPIESVEVPPVFSSGSTYQIQYTYKRPTNCHFFDDLYYVINGNTRTIAVTNFVTDEGANGAICVDIQDAIISQQFDFNVSNTVGSQYTFRFWQGINEENGEDIYLVVDVPVIE